MEAHLKMIAAELEKLRKLAVFALQNAGVSQGKIAAALGTTQATISRQSSPKKQSRKKSRRAKKS